VAGVSTVTAYPRLNEGGFNVPSPLRGQGEGIGYTVTAAGL